MKRAREDNTVGIIQRAVKHHGLHVTGSTVKQALKSHPDYPSFKSICDTLDEWNIDNYPLRYEINELEDLQPPYIVHFDQGGGMIGFVSVPERIRLHIIHHTPKKEKPAVRSFSAAVPVL